MRATVNIAHMNYSLHSSEGGYKGLRVWGLHSFKGCYTGVIYPSIIGDVKRDARSSDNGLSGYIHVASASRTQNTSPDMPQRLRVLARY